MSDKEQRIIISVEGGVITFIDIPVDCNVVVEIRDYDTDGADINDICKDDNGEYRVSEWEN